MASAERALATNAPGDFFVDDSCIDCDACRWIAPQVFDASGDFSRVHRQPQTEQELFRALSALVACPTASIGTREEHDVGRVAASFPQLLDVGGPALDEQGQGEVYHCGFHSEASFGAASYLIRRSPERGGNVLVDSPRFSAPLVRRIEELGGLSTIFLTHKDDVADHARFARHFGARRVLHRDDVEDSTRDVELQPTGDGPLALDAELLAIPVSGHTRGSMCLLHRERYLFSGDHVAWSPSRGQVYAFRSACWYDWETQIESMERLATHRFEWILPGHGRQCRFDAGRMRAEMARCIAWMRK
jgi:glyoxylase-like metal-dependent hydrolase (beta-lactamase superfamily II)/ferredoxin